MNSFAKYLTAFCLLATISAQSSISSAAAASEPLIGSLTQTTDLWDHGTFHVIRYASETPIQFLGIVGGHLLASVASDQHQWFFNNAFVPVRGTDAAKALGYPVRVSSESLLSVSKKSLCLKYKDTITEVAITDKRTLCLRSTPGGDFTLNLMPEDKKLSVGFGKQPILEKNKLTWIGIDGNLYVAFLHPDFFNTTVSALKTKTNPAVFLLRNGVKYSIPNEPTYFSWFDSFKTVTVVDAKKLLSYPYIGNSSYRANTLLKFKGSPDVYVYQPANDPYLVFGKDAKILEDGKESWTIQITKGKAPTVLAKRLELLRPLTHESDAIDLFGQNWTKRIIELDDDKQSRFLISEKPFVASTDFLIE